ncbi:hypothetical protein CEXT_259091 [Caerostris extrusa]|uniref:Peptidase S1 domain-containing protein n=1 Tax=Caerostris extrusa TaxID=172846 RepID=A0AAV4SXC2_CAEEX|nr:hypothetical protein CEXT_259091 [Caerostris extrusa]
MSSATDRFRKGNLPTICGWIGDVPFVCCPNTVINEDQSSRTFNSVKPTVQTYELPFVELDSKEVCIRSGMCYNIALCPTAMENFRTRSGGLPEVCGWEKGIFELVVVGTVYLIMLGIHLLREDICRISYPEITVIYAGRVLPPIHSREACGLAAIFIADSRIHLCGATVIDDRHILTAAHCFDGRSLNPQDFIIEISETNLLTIGRRREIQENQTP